MYAQAATKPNPLLRSGAYGTLQGCAKMHAPVFIVTR